MGIFVNLPQGRFRTIVIDPPWKYKQRLASPKARGGIAYPTLTVAQLKTLPVKQLADDDCQLWLWTTNAHHHDAFHLLEEWGFTHKTTATWVKTQIGLGFWLRGKTEHILLGVVGNPRERMIGLHGAMGLGNSTLIMAPRRKHSQKPEAFYDMLDVISEPPRLEMFARRLRLGWTAWGNEV